MRVFGLTGGIASGKSTVAHHLRARGVPILDADVLARAAVAPGSAALSEIREHFGAQALTAEGALNRAWLGERVFHDPAELAVLNRIVHPRVAQLFRDECLALEHAGHRLVGYEVPLLFENGLEKGLSPVVVVGADPELQVSRAMERNGWSKDHTEARLAAQWPLADKLARADYVIDNSGSLAQTFAQADAVLAQLRALEAESAS
jgi:dephospho-CoA kinase